MPDDDLPAHVVNFVIAHISSVMQLELLLHLQADPSVARGAEELGRELRIYPEWVISHITPLCRDGIVVRHDGEVPRFQFPFGLSEVQRTVSDLKQVYEERRVSLISLIFNKPISHC